MPLAQTTFTRKRGTEKEYAVSGGASGRPFKCHAVLQRLLQTRLRTTEGEV